MAQNEMDQLVGIGQPGQASLAHLVPRRVQQSVMRRQLLGTGLFRS